MICAFCFDRSPFFVCRPPWKPQHARFLVITLIVIIGCFNGAKIFFTTLNVLKWIKDTHREKAPSNKTPAFTKSKSMDIWVVGTSNQLFIRGS